MAPPDDYGWAYIDAQRATASAEGPSGSLQFRWGAETLRPGKFSGSADLIFQAADDDHKVSPNASGSALYLYGSMYVSGAIHAETYTIRQVTSTEIDVSGSTKFGDSSDDTHQRTGSLEVSGPTHLKNTLSVTGAVSPLTSSGEIHAARLVSNDIFTSGSVGIGTSTPTEQPAEKNDLVIGNHSGNRGITIASTGTGTGTIRFAPTTSANNGEGWIDYSNNTKKFRLGTDGLNTRVVVDSVGTQVTGTLEVSSNVVAGGDVHVAGGVKHLGDDNTGLIFNDVDDVSLKSGGFDAFRICTDVLSDDDSQVVAVVNPLKANLDFLVSGDTSERVLHVQVAAAGSGPAESVHISGALGPTSGSGEIHASRFVSNDIFTSGSVGVGTSTPTSQPAEKNDLVIGNGTGNRGMTIATAGTGVGTIRFARSTSANDGEGWVDYSGNTKKMRIGTDGLTTRVVVHSVGTQVTGTLEVSSNTNIAGNAKFGYANSGTGSTSVTTFYNTLSGAAAGDGGGDIFANQLYVNDIFLSGTATGITATYVSGTSADPRSYSYEGWETQGYLKASGSLTLGADAVIGGLLKMPDNTSAKILVADGTSFQEVAVSGDIGIASNGAVTITNDAVEQAMIADDAVGADQLASDAVVEASIVDNAVTLAKMAGLARGKIIVGDASGDPSALAAGANGKILVADANGDPSWTTLSGDATLSAGALTIANDAVEQAMIADDAVGADQLAASAVVNASVVDGSIKADKLDIDGSTDIGAALSDADLIIVDDGAGGTNRKAAVSRIKTYTRTDVSALGAAEADKALILNSDSKIASGLVGLTGSGDLYFKDVKATSNLISDGGLGVSGSTVVGALAANTHQVTGSFEVSGPANFTSVVSAESALTVGTLFKMPDNTSAKILVADGTSYQEVAISGDIGISSAGEVAIANDAVEQAMIADDAVGADQLASNAVVNASVADGTIKADKLDIDGSTDIGAALADADLFIVDDGAGGTNRKAAATRIKTYTRTDVSALGAAEASKALILNADSKIASGLVGLTGSGDLYFKDVKATSNLISDGGLLISGSTTLAAGLSSSQGMAIPDNEHLRLGAANDLKIFHNGSNNLFVGQTGHMRFDNQATGKHIQMDLGADDATTQFQVRNNSGNDLLVVDGVGMQVTGTLEVSSNANFTAATSHEAGLTSTTMSGSGNLSAHGSAHIGGTLTMDGAGIVFNVANSAGTVNLQVNDGAGADTAITLGKNGKVTKIGDDTPTDGQYLSWDASGGKVAWSDGTTPDMSGSDNHYSSTEFRTSGDLKVSGSVTLAGIGSASPVGGLFLGLDSNNNIVKAVAGGNWVLEDDDGTEVTIEADKEIKFIGSGITTNWTDTDNGTDADPYDMTFTIDAAQTGITSIFATDLKIGEDDQTKIDFETADEIHFYAANAHEVTLAANNLSPATADGIALGTAAAEWSDLYLADGGIIYFGNDQDVLLAHSPDDGLILKRSSTADDSPPALTLQSGETSITNTDVIGLLQWQAPDETQGGDGALVVASIEAIATNTFNATQNPTNLVFKTSLDGAAVKHLVLDSAGELKGFESNSETWNINAAGTGSFVQLAVADRLIHTGDANTFINFAPDTIDFHAGTTTQPQMRISSGEIVLNEDSSNRDFRIESNADTHAFFIDGGDATAFCKVAGGYGSTGVTIGVTGSIAADNFIHSDERIQSNTYLQAPAIYDGGGNVALSFDNSNGYIDNDVTIESNTARLDLASNTGESIIGIYGPGGTISNGGNIGSLRWFGTETDGKAGNPAETARILVEGDESAWTYDSSLGSMMKFAIGIDGSTTLSETMAITGYAGGTDGGRVGIGTLDPAYKFEVESDAASTYIAQFRQHASNGYGIRIRNNDDSAGRHVTFANDGGTNGGHITMDGTTVSYGAFTAYHPAALPAADNDTGYDYGTLVKITSVDSTTHSKSVLYSVAKTTAAQDKAVFGVYSSALGTSYNDDGSEDMESGRHSIFAVGDGHILVCSEGGNIEAGDYICSSNTDGHGMKQSDDILRNYTVAKASEPVDWSTEDANTKLIACTYHAG